MRTLKENYLLKRGKLTVHSQTKHKLTAKERDEMMMQKMKERMGQEGDEGTRTEQNSSRILNIMLYLNV